MTALTYSVGQPFRLHLPHQVLDGWELTDRQALVIDDGGHSLTSAATTADLIRGYGGGHLEWLEQHHPAQHDQ
ncbi:hypothetical protein [Streptomyces sp. NPDC001914]|uniref:hypothetical protein n=1 Tax=Streptomyces sp. NPDC001914 TaxID=3364623 RepID=UPI0036D19C8B